MAKFEVSRSLEIGASAAEIFRRVRDFSSWPEWSPWLMTDPDGDVEVEKDWYSWAGDICGAGRVDFKEAVPDQFLSYDLYFFKPWKSHAVVKISFADRGESTEVTWEMESSLPFYLFWMGTMMEGYVGIDHERGLLMLKDLVEKGAVPSKLKFGGAESCEGFSGVGIKRQSGFTEMGSMIGEDLKKVRAEFPEGEGFCVYYKWDVVRRSVVYLIGAKVEEVPEESPKGMEVVTVPETKIYTLRHHGPYRHLGNGWSAGMMHGRAKRFKHARDVPPFEIYERESDGDDTVVKICFPAR